MRRLVYLILVGMLPLLAARCPAKNKAGATVAAASPAATAAGDCPPAKIQARIAELKAQPKANPAYEVWECNYLGQKAYLISAPCCDNYTTLYDTCLNVLCAPSGGFTGRGDGQCPDFKEKATDLKLVWRDPR